MARPDKLNEVRGRLCVAHLWRLSCRPMAMTHLLTFRLQASGGLDDEAEAASRNIVSGFLQEQVCVWRAMGAAGCRWLERSENCFN